MSRAGGVSVSGDLSVSDFEREAHRAGFDLVGDEWFSFVGSKYVRFRPLAPSRRGKLREMLEARARFSCWTGEGVRYG